jgi:membrane protease YdiL (CAAX protease family)
MHTPFSGWIARHIPHPIVRQQVSAPQPSLLLLLLCFFTPGWMPKLVAYVLIQWPSFGTFASEHPALYSASFLGVQLCLMFGVAGLLSWKYPSASWSPQPSLRHAAATLRLVLLPLFLFHLFRSLRGIGGLIALSALGAEANGTLSSIHHEAWGRLAYDSSLTGVVCSCILSFASPVWEELIFSGFVVNSIAKRSGFAAAIVATPALFSLLHAFEFGLGEHLIPLFFAGLTYTLLRVSGGSIWLAIMGHWAINAVIFLPKWLVAFLHFTRV